MTFAEETHILQPQQRERVRKGHALEFLVDYFAKETRGGRHGAYLDWKTVQHLLMQQDFLPWYGHDAYDTLKKSSASDMYKLIVESELSRYFGLLFYRRCRKMNREFQYGTGIFSFEELHLESEKSNDKNVIPFRIVYRP